MFDEPPEGLVASPSESPSLISTFSTTSNQRQHTRNTINRMKEMNAFQSGVADLLDNLK